MRRVLLFLLICSIKTLAQNVTYQARDGIKSVVSNTTFFVDSTGQMTFEQVRALPQSAFRQQPNKRLDLGDTNKPVWFRFRYLNGTNEDIYLITSYVRWADVYKILPNDSLWIVKGGFVRPIEWRKLKTSHPNFYLGKTGGEVFVHVKNPNMNLRLELTDAISFVERYHQRDLLIGGILGVMLAIAFYNLFLYFSVKDSLHLYYFGYVICSAFIIVKVNGLHHAWLVHSAILMHDINFTNTLTMMMLFIFSYHYLNLGSLAPRWYKWLWVLSIFLILIALCDFLPYQTWMSVSAQIGILVFVFSLFFASLYVWYIGYTPARFFVLAFGCYIAGVCVTLMGLLRIFFTWHNGFTYYAYNLGSVLETMFFSFAIGHRMGVFKKQATEAQSLALRRAQENEELLAKNNELLAEKLSKEQMPTV
jgi:two-component system, sensor histidine kinase LadS